MTGEAAAHGPRSRPVRHRHDRGVLGTVMGELCAVAGETPWPGHRPWRLRVRSDALELLADRSARRDVLTAGAALLNLRIAVEHAGLVPRVTATPADEHEVLARVRAENHPPAAYDDRLLYAELQRRHDGARQFAAPAMPPGLTAHLAAAVEAEQARLVPFGGGWPAGQAYAVGLLVTAGDSVADWLRAGQAAQRLHLTAAVAWLTVRCHAGLLDSPRIREGVRRDLCPDGVPQVILELGQRTAPVA